MSIFIILPQTLRLLVVIRCLGCFIIEIHEYLNKKLFFGAGATEKNSHHFLFYYLEKESHNLLCINHEDLILMVIITSYRLIHLAVT